MLIIMNHKAFLLVSFISLDVMIDITVEYLSLMWPPQTRTSPYKIRGWSAILQVFFFWLVCASMISVAWINVFTFFGNSILPTKIKKLIPFQKRHCCPLLLSDSPSQTFYIWIYSIILKFLYLIVMWLSA